MTCFEIHLIKKKGPYQLPSTKIELTKVALKNSFKKKNTGNRFKKTTMGDAKKRIKTNELIGINL